MKISKKEIVKTEFEFSLEHEALLRKNIEDAKIALNDYRWLLLDYLTDQYTLRELSKLIKVDKAILCRVHNKKQLMNDSMYTSLINFINERKA